MENGELAMREEWTVTHIGTLLMTAFPFSSVVSILNREYRVLFIQ